MIPPRPRRGSRARPARPRASVLAPFAGVVLFTAPAAAVAQNGAGEGDGCTEGVITSVELDRQSVFDPSSTDLAALAWTYRALNLLHMRTAESFIRRELLFTEGDCLDPFLLEQSELLLDGYEFLARATITHEDDGSGGRRVLVSTRDEWSTKVDIGGTYDDGLNLERLQVTEENFLGQGIFAEFTHRERREVNRQSFGIATPRLFGRTDASVAFGRDRPGRFFEQYVRYPFIGETGRYSVREGFRSGTSFFSYATDATVPFDQVLVPAYRELVELSAARRFGERGRSVIVGASLMRDVVDFPGSPEVAYESDFDELQPWTGPLLPRMAEQLVATSSTRAALHVGTRRFDYEEYQGLDGVRDRQIVALGYFAGLTVGRGFDVLTPEGSNGVADGFGRIHASFGVPAGPSLLHGRVTAEARRDGGRFEDVLVDADVVAYLRSPSFASHTLFLRGSAAGGWSTTLPFQLSLGGREAVRSLREDRFPGGRMIRFVIEDRIVFPWPSSDNADLGFTIFSDLGRMWPGDVPYGVDSSWRAGLGFGLRIGVPAGTRNIWRTDLVFPIEPAGGRPIFRVTFELNRLRSGFFNPDVFRSRRFDMGPDHF